MPSSRRLAAAAVTTGLVASGVVASAVVPAIGDEPACNPQRRPIAFEQHYIDDTRAGGEPLVATHPDGTLLWGSHAGTTHFFTPEAGGGVEDFLAKYEGQTYQYWSEDGGETWNFSPRTPVTAQDPTAGVPNSGFSDPEFAVDAAGNVFISEINLANIAFSKSTDSGRTWTLQNVAGLTMTDRQWMEADVEDMLWVVGNTFGGGSTPFQPVTPPDELLDNRLYKSTDGGVTWTVGQSMGSQQFNDIEVDQRDGRLFQIHYVRSRRPQPLEMWYAPDARQQAPGAENPDGTVGVQFEEGLIADGVSKLSIMGGDISLDRDGNVYVVWDESGAGARPAGIWYAYSTDRGATWSDPVRVSAARASTSIWPWISVGDPGQVGISWLQQRHLDEEGKRPAPDDATGPWDIVAAHTATGLGCDESERPGFVVQRASQEPPHTGTLCNSGTVCQAQFIDRRLGDYHSNEMTKDGRFYIAVSDTRQGGAVALPLVIRQVAGEPFVEPTKGRRPHDVPPKERGKRKGQQERSVADARPLCPPERTCPGPF